MFTNRLYEEALVAPIKKGCQELYVVSGFATATFVNRHLSQEPDFKVNLIIGMPGNRSDHLGFLSLYKRYKGRFKGFYITNSPQVHSKVYAWHKNGVPEMGFSGSANYTQPGFTGSQQVNQLVADDPNVITNFFEDLVPRAIEMRDYKYDPTSLLITQPTIVGSLYPGEIFWDVPDKRVTISFLDRRGIVSERSGLNWGQRPELGREPNQAYLSLRKDARKEGFLPPIGETFTLITDDNVAIDCVVAQDGRKAIHSTFDNSEIGRYIRNRIGVSLGALVKASDLERYGRTDFSIEKLDDETFYLDMSVKSKMK